MNKKLMVLLLTAVSVGSIMTNWGRRGGWGGGWGGGPGFGIGIGRGGIGVGFGGGWRGWGWNGYWGGLGIRSPYWYYQPYWWNYPDYRLYDNQRRLRREIEGLQQEIYDLKTNNQDYKEKMEKLRKSLGEAQSLRT